MSSPLNVVFYRYDGSPFSNKINSILLLKNIPHTIVNVSSILPRPELSELLGISYRRIPVLAIGNDIYCDTSLIASTLERRFPPAKGYGTIFPVVKNTQGAIDSGIQKAYAKFYCDGALFRLASGLLPWDKLPQNFLDDRSSMAGVKLDPKAMVARQPIAHSDLSSHLALAEEQLSDGRKWLFNTEAPGLSDISLHFVLSFIQPLPGVGNVLHVETFPKTLAWLNRFTTLLDEKARESSASLRKISGRRAAEVIGSAEHESPRIVGFYETEASRLGLKLGMAVSVMPDDYSPTHPTQGRLVGLNREEVVIETKGTTNANVRVHFPKLGFVVKKITSTSLAKL